MESRKATPKLVQTVARVMANMGHTETILKSDHGPSMKPLANWAEGMRSHPTIVEESPEYEPRANRIAERRVKGGQGVVRNGDERAQDGREHCERPHHLDLFDSACGEHAQQLPRGNGRLNTLGTRSGR